MCGDKCRLQSMDPFFYFALFSLSIPLSNGFLNYLQDNEIEVMASLFARQVKIDYLKYYLINNEKTFYVKTGIVLKPTEINILEDLFESDPINVVKFSWIIFTAKNFESHFKISYNCEFFIIQKNQSNLYEMKEVYHVKHSGPYINHFGYWSSPSDHFFNSEGFYVRRKNMQGAQLVRTDNNGFTICFNFSIEIKHREIWWDLSRLLNYTLKVVGVKLTNDTITSPDAPDGTACGLGHHVINYFPDVVNPTELRPVYMIIRYENDFGEGWKAYIKPFSNSIWYSILGWLIVSSFAFLFMKVFSNSNMDVGIFTSLYCICEQDGILSPQANSPSAGIRIAYLNSCIVPRIVVPAFGAAILAILTAQLPRIPFSDFEGFLQDGTYKLGSLNQTFMIKYFKRSSEPLLSRIYRETFMDEKEFPNVYEDAAKRLCRDNRFAFLSYRAEMVEETLQCRLLKIPKPFLTIVGGFRMRPGSPFKPVFSELLIKFYNIGIIHRQNLTENILKKEIIKRNKPLTISQVSAILCLIPLGILTSLLFLVLEIIIYNQKKK